MEKFDTLSNKMLDEDAALKAILEGTANETGQEFFKALVENLAQVLNTSSAWVTEYVEDSRTLRALAFWAHGKWVNGIEYQIDGTPCQKVIDEACPVHVPEQVITLYPEDEELQRFNAVSYMGVPLQDIDGNVLGNLAIMDSKPMPEQPRAQALFQIFAARAAAEHQRLQAEKKVREREQKLSRLINSAMDAIIELNHELMITEVNPAAKEAFQTSADQIIGKNFSQLVVKDSRDKLKMLVDALHHQPEGKQYMWIPWGLMVESPEGDSFSAEATISRFEMNREIYYTIILRNVNERLEAEKKINSLTEETAYLREEIKELQKFNEILGQSPALLQVLHDVHQVAKTDSTVLIEGETGTGKELIARELHNASLRSQKPLIKVNCATIPANLMESEFFGHEKGAFTGATAKREGRFALADGGTIFLDEIGELPVDLQVKLLRVLQEGEFEPVGSSKTRKVNVRVIAATNRDLLQEIKEGNFRADLYYRLNVFPIKVPPLRERTEDIPLLASFFAEKYSQKIGKQLLPLSESCIRKLSAYNWPGNVRELENVIERAVITARDGQLNLDRALPEIESKVNVRDNIPAVSADGQIRTAKDMLELERQNLLLALEKTDWKVSGENGAARLLGIPPSTLSSRMKALGIKKMR